MATTSTYGDEYRIINWVLDEQEIEDEDMLVLACEGISATDLRDELAVGQVVTHVSLTYEPGGQRGDLVIIHGDNRGGIALGAGSDWGDWSPAEKTLALDDGPVLTVAGSLIYTGAPEITADDVRELLTSGSMDPTLVRWLDTGEVEVVAGVLFSDISYSGRNREHDVICTAADLRSSGDWDIENPTQDDYAAFAQQLNES